jgi:hypothetical protein
LCWFRLCTPLHGYGIARRIEQISGDLLAVNQGTLYPLLLKLEHEGMRARSPPIGAASENNRRARSVRPGVISRSLKVGAVPPDERPVSVKNEGFQFLVLPARLAHAYDMRTL